MNKDDFQEYVNHLEKIKAVLEKNLNVEKEVSAEENIVESNVNVSEQEKTAAIKSLLGDSKKIYKKLNRAVKKLKIKTFFKRLLGLPLIAAGGLIELITLAGAGSFLGGALTFIGSAIVSFGAGFAGNDALAFGALKVLGISGIVALAGAVVSGIAMGVMNNDEAVDAVLNNTLGIGFDLLSPLPLSVTDGDILDALNEAKDTYNNLKVKYKSEKGKEATV